MARSLQEMGHDPYETPVTGGSSGSGGALQSHYPTQAAVTGAPPPQRPSPLQSATPNQSDGEGSIIPQGPPRIAAAAAPLVPAQPVQPMVTTPAETAVATPVLLPQMQMSPEELCMTLENRIKRGKIRIMDLVERISAVDQETTNEDVIELNELKQFVADCQRHLENVKEQRLVEAISRPPVQLGLPNLQVATTKGWDPLYGGEHPKDNQVGSLGRVGLI